MSHQRQIRQTTTRASGHAAQKCVCSLAGTAVLLGLLVSVSSLLADGPSSEYRVKAAFLLNFTKFVEWPATAFESADSPLTICILGEDPFGSFLDQVVEGETVNGRKLIIQRLRRPPKPKTCQVLYISKSEKDVAATVSELGPGVLTVADDDRFLRDGVVIAFVIDDRHVRFDINQRAAANSSLTVSARLLNVARSVQR